MKRVIGGSARRWPGLVSVLTLLVSAVGIIVAGASSAAGATTVNVPAEVATIQGAIESAAAGDTIVAAPGTYHENLNFLGKDLVVRSSGGPSVTTVDGDAKDPVAWFVHGETRVARAGGFHAA